MRRSDKRVVLHVGAHKTGTTVVQQHLLGHVAELRRSSIRYVSRPELTPLVGWGDQLVADPSGFVRLLDDFAAGAEQVLLASHENICGAPFAADGEGLYPRSGPVVDVLADLLARFDTTVVLTVRPPHELLESYYLQQVNLGGVTPFGRWLSALDLDALSWRPLVTRLRAAFGDDRVVIIDFGTIRAGSVPYVRELLRRVGLTAALDQTRVRPLNPSVSAQGLRLLLRANAELPDAADRAAVRSFVQRHFSNATGERPVLLDPSTRALVRDRYADEYAELVSA